TSSGIKATGPRANAGRFYSNKKAADCSTADCQNYSRFSGDESSREALMPVSSQISPKTVAMLVEKIIVPVFPKYTCISAWPNFKSQQRARAIIAPLNSHIVL